MQFVIVTGMSGAGKSTALKLLEDIGFFCVDNLPPTLISKFVEVCSGEDSEIDKVALGVDIRGGKLFDGLLPGLTEVYNGGYNYSILFLDCSDEVLLKRYKESRRNHPLAKSGRISGGIEKERELLAEIKELSTYIIDTSSLLTRQLKEKLNDIFVENKSFNSLIINIVSFGYKYGIPNDSDLVFDVRFIPNPFYIPEMKPLTGNDPLVKQYVMSWEVTLTFLDKLKEMLAFLIPNYINEGKNQLVVSIGCTGGKHRSVTLANELREFLDKMGHTVLLNHRDIPHEKL